jgi:hypothetical protein
MLSTIVSWPGDYARRAAVTLRDGLFYIDDEDHIFGWMQIDNADQLQPFDPSDKEQILAKYLEVPSIGLLGYLLGWSKRSESNRCR